MSDITMVGLLKDDVWGTHAPLMACLQSWRNYDLFYHTLSSLNVDALYKSHLHGQGHIERTILLAALLARQEDLSDGDAGLLFQAASYHDVGRVDDGYDTEHGTRSARRLNELTGRSGENLLLMQGAVAAHSRPDHLLEKTVEEYHPADFPHAVGLAQYLKDADGLDRVRIRDLNPAVLRHDSARALVPFAQFLFELYLSRGAAVAAYWSPDAKRFVYAGM